MTDYQPLQEYLEHDGRKAIKCSFDTLEKILETKMDPSGALFLQAHFQGSYLVDSISMAEKTVVFRRKENLDEDEGTIAATLASLLWW
jgi:hypothetical protein